MNTKFKNIFLVALLATAGVSYGQVRIAHSNLNASAANSSAFIDASSNTTYNGSLNLGKGLLYPRVDLSTFPSFGGTPTGIPTSYPTRYDGFVVYNTKEGGVAQVGNTEGTLTPGFWFYENKSATLNGGTWKRLGSTGKVAISDVLTGTPTNVIVAGDKEVYAVRGQFTTNGTSTAVTLAIPTGISSLYRITIYKDDAVYGSSVYKYNKVDGSAVTGAPGMSVVYPAATYDYVLEYLK